MRKLSRSAAAVTALALIIAACGGTDDEPTSTPTPTPAPSTSETPAELSGSVNLDGSSTVGPFQEVAAELFMDENPGVRVTVAISGTGGGFDKFCQGETDASNASRYIKDSEVEVCAENGVNYDFIQVANDALSVVVNNDNPIACLTVDQVSQIWDEGSTVTTWGDVDGLDLPADFASTPVQLYGPGTDSGTFDFFTDEINGESGRINTTYTDIGEDDTAAVVGVAGTVGAMGFIPFSYYQETKDQVKGVAIDGGDGCVDPTPENVLGLTYVPLGRGLFTYFSDVAFARPETVAFAEFVLDNAIDIADKADFVPLTPAQIEVERAKVRALAGN